MSIAINTNSLKNFQFSIVNYQLAFVTILMLMISMGINAQNVNQLFKEGKALYEAKNGGRNRTVQSGSGSSEDEGYA